MKTLFTIFVSLAIAASVHSQSLEYEDYSQFFYDGELISYYDRTSIEYRNGGDRVNLWSMGYMDYTLVWMSLEVRCSAQTVTSLQAKIPRYDRPGFVILSNKRTRLKTDAAMLTLIENVCE